MAQGKKFQPTDEQRRTVETMIAAGIREELIGRCLSIGRMTLRKYFREEIETAAAKANTNVVATLYKMATSGKVPAATIFWAKCRLHWKEVSGLEMSGPDGSAIQHSVSPLDALESQLARINARESTEENPPGTHAANA